MNIIKTTLAALCLSATSAAAIPVGWSFSLSDTAGSLSGSFIYDADTDVYSNIAMTATPAGGTGVLVSNYFAQTAAPDTAVFWSTPTPTVGGTVVFLSAPAAGHFTNAGGTATRNISANICNSLGGFSGCLGTTGITIGSATFKSFVPPAAVPLPATGALLLSGFAALGWGAARRRKSPGALATA